MTTIEQSTPADAMAVDPTLVATQPTSRAEAIAAYHSMGPCYELEAADAGPLLNLAAATLLDRQQGESDDLLVSRLVTNLRNTEAISASPEHTLDAVSMLYDTVRALGADPSDATTYAFGNALLERTKTLQSSVYRGAGTTAQKMDAAMGIATSKDELSRRGVKQTKLVETRTGDRKTVTESEESWRVTALERVLEQRTKPANPNETPAQAAGDGKMFEYAIVAAAQFKLWQGEKEDAVNFARLANEREDRPQPGMPREIGTRVAHDVVIVRGEETVRIQSKCGDGAHQTDPGRYDLEKIVLVIDDASRGRQFNNMVQDVIDSYKGDESAIARVDGLLQRLNLQRFLS